MYLDVEATMAPPQIGNDLSAPKHPALQPSIPAFGLISWLGWQPHCYSEDFVTLGLGLCTGILGDVKERIINAPFAARAERSLVAPIRELI